LNENEGTAFSQGFNKIADFSIFAAY